VRIENQSAVRTKGRELNDHKGDIDTFTLAVYVVALTLGTLFAGVLVVVFF
jgi:hypothetical protein